MENKKDFEELYIDIYNNSEKINESLKQAKLEKKKLGKIKLLICLTVDIILIYFNICIIPKGMLLFQLLFLLMLIIILDTIICIVINTVFGKKQKEYNHKFKETIISKFMDNFYDNLEYFPNKELPKLVYQEANYNEYYDSYYSKDYLEAKINNEYDIDLAEVKTYKEEHYTDSDGNSHTRTVTIFHGLFAKIVIDKSINCKLQIVRNNELSFDKKRLEMDSSEFEKHFDVSSDNKIIGMQVLTPDVMETLLEFLNKSNIIYDIFINNNIIYIRFHCGDMFEAASLKKGAYDRQTLKKYYDMLEFTYNLSCELINTIKNVEI